MLLSAYYHVRSVQKEVLPKVSVIISRVASSFFARSGQPKGRVDFSSDGFFRLKVDLVKVDNFITDFRLLVAKGVAPLERLVRSLVESSPGLYPHKLQSELLN